MENVLANASDVSQGHMTSGQVVPVMRFNSCMFLKKKIFATTII